ncbi:hypothetical protein GIB67_042284 [Kingdonia uniflora]|uniref:DUF7356 domain-containing protein n=1 Tax=Kingdonia uniflora TaxID=39325 RepID=A0A7J7LDX2_9MAGN|nr:hypothetical protein GIB67_042284 [Kingdonia uniflora]
MKRYLAVLVLSMVVVVSFGANLEVKSTDPDIGIGMKYSSPPNDSSILKSSESVSVLDSTKIGKEEKIESQEGVGKDVQIKESQEKKGGDKREGLIDESQPKKLPEERKKEGESVPVKPLMPESVPGEECDSSNKCTVENKLVACLRVPGNGIILHLYA